MDEQLSHLGMRLGNPVANDVTAVRPFVTLFTPLVMLRNCCLLKFDDE